MNSQKRYYRQQPLQGQYQNQNLPYDYLKSGTSSSMAPSSLPTDVPAPNKHKDLPMLPAQQGEAFSEQSTATPAFLDEGPNITNVSDTASETSDGNTKYEWNTPAGKRVIETPTKAEEQRMEENIKRSQDMAAKTSQEREEKQLAFAMLLSDKFDPAVAALSAAITLAAHAAPASDAADAATKTPQSPHPERRR
ncbi:hypothetical protein MRS44_004241 [Fusarium solani]|uniref:uncharacterized protein n=1 Tax=Fusarium solani TaxID=169388 RepID=UPI0032C3FBE9|nr:hypothetical protein MRS44_004241 [Fusarium solani]